MINRECPKCGDTMSSVRYNQVMDHMQLECRLCKYEWTLKPLDVIRADEERQRATSGKPADEAKP